MIEIIVRINEPEDVLQAEELVAELLQTQPYHIVLGITESQQRAGIGLKNVFPIAHVDLYVDCGVQKWKVFRDYQDLVPLPADRKTGPVSQP